MPIDFWNICLCVVHWMTSENHGHRASLGLLVSVQTPIVWMSESLKFSSQNLDHLLLRRWVAKKKHIFYTKWMLSTVSLSFRRFRVKWWFWYCEKSGCTFQIFSVLRCCGRRRNINTDLGQRERRISRYLAQQAPAWEALKVKTFLRVLFSLNHRVAFPQCTEWDFAKNVTILDPFFSIKMTSFLRFFRLTRLA